MASQILNSEGQADENQPQDLRSSTSPNNSSEPTVNPEPAVNPEPPVVNPEPPVVNPESHINPPVIPEQPRGQDDKAVATAIKQAEQAIRDAVASVKEEARKEAQKKAEQATQALADAVATAIAEAEKKTKQSVEAANKRAEQQAEKLRLAMSAAVIEARAANDERGKLQKALAALKTSTQKDAQAANVERVKLQEALAALKLSSETDAQAMFEKWKAEWEEKHRQIRRVLPQGVFERPANVQEEDLENWIKLDLDSVEEEAHKAIEAQTAVEADPKLERNEAMLPVFETSQSDSIKWIRAADNSRRIPLTRVSSIDPSEVTCPAGMVVVGVALGPWKGTNSSGALTVDKVPCIHMSIKLLCRDASGEEKLYGNQGAKINQPSMTGVQGSGQLSAGARKCLPWPSSSLAQLYCDSRPIFYQRFVTGDGKNEAVDAKAISSLAFYNFKVGTTGSRFGLLPTFQDSQCPRIIPTPEAISRVYDQDTTKSHHWFRKAGQLRPEEVTTTGIDRLYYDTNVVMYKGWQVTGVQMYLKGTDTIALNVRFQNLPTPS